MPTPIVSPTRPLPPSNLMVRDVAVPTVGDADGVRAALQRALPNTGGFPPGRTPLVRLSAQPNE
jgi:hypothetical protein